MAVTDKTRKILWGRSGNLCALCRRVLVEEGTPTDDDSVVGDECHIIGEKPGAARGDLGLGRDDLDEPDNLILLCKVHHKLVDDQPQTYTVERLKVMKAAHEHWVHQTLAGARNGHSARFALLFRVRTGKELSTVIADACGFVLDHDELETEAEVKLVGGFLQTIQDWGDIWPNLDSGQHVEVRFSLTNDIKEIEEAGFLVFATRDRRRLFPDDKTPKWPVGIVTVVRPTNKGITELGELASLIVT